MLGSFDNAAGLSARYIRRINNARAHLHPLLTLLRHPHIKFPLLDFNRLQIAQDFGVRNKNRRGWNLACRSQHQTSEEGEHATL